MENFEFTRQGKMPQSKQFKYKILSTIYGKTHKLFALHSKQISHQNMHHALELLKQVTLSTQSWSGEFSEKHLPLPRARNPYLTIE